ncbi:hypothetical protein PIB30_044234 [Stylosanthes scabra]|uniref:Uncharacterized protein n=1 Tax=Stylosanthes scabra TaxID=79078 RepID=A0ABU6WGY5_9FABA|nr:hypothetical protein [Stylosanthes scabra]
MDMYTTDASGKSYSDLFPSNVGLRVVNRRMSSWFSPPYCYIPANEVEYPIVQMYEAPDLRTTHAPYDIQLSSLHPWMPPAPPPVPPAEVFEEDDDEMAQAEPEGPPEMDGLFPHAPVPAQLLQMAALVDDMPDPPLANGILADHQRSFQRRIRLGRMDSLQTHLTEVEPVWDPGLCPTVISAVFDAW